MVLSAINYHCRLSYYKWAVGYDFQRNRYFIWAIGDIFDVV